MKTKKPAASILETYIRDGWIQLVAGVEVPLGADPPQDLVVVVHYAQFDEKGKLLQLTAERPGCFKD